MLFMSKTNPEADIADPETLGSLIAEQISIQLTSAEELDRGLKDLGADPDIIDLQDTPTQSPEYLVHLLGKGFLEVAHKVKNGQTNDNLGAAAMISGIELALSVVGDTLSSFKLPLSKPEDWDE